LNRHLIYRLRCIDYLPPELEVLYVKDGRVRLKGGNGAWTADVTVVGFGDESRWWMVGLEWGWRVKEKGVDDPGGDQGKRFEGEERQGILDLVNGEVLLPKIVPEAKETTVNMGGPMGEATSASKISVKAVGLDIGVPIVNGVTPSVASPASQPGIIATEVAKDIPEESIVDAPLVRLCNFLRKSS
jgi:hypothetical protein